MLKSEYYPWLEKAISWLEQHLQEPPALEALAPALGLNPCAFERLLQEAMGCAARDFLQAASLREAPALLQELPALEAPSVLLESGPQSARAVCAEFMPPVSRHLRGAGLQIRWGVHSTPFGPALLALSQQGLLELDFLPDQRCLGVTPAEQLALKWPGAEIQQAPQDTTPVVSQIFSFQPVSLTVHLRGSAFQLQVWQALLRIPPGHLTSYAALARWLGHPQASRAVGRAVAQNPVSYLLPCHRVLRSDGGIGGYAGGTVRKRILLAWERAALGSVNSCFRVVLQPVQ